jgi:hypothetical protein
MSALAPTCGGSCSNGNITYVSGQSSVNYFLLYYMVGSVRSLYDTTTGNSTLLSYNQGPLTEIQPILRNMTALTNATYSVFQYSSKPTASFERITTTLPQQNGQYALCTTLSTPSPAYLPLTMGKSYSGQVTIYGQAYYALYVPIFDAFAKALIGSLFVGVHD